MLLERIVTHITRLNVFYIATLLFVAAFFCYTNTLGNQLFFDDEQFIYNNESVKTFDITEIFSRSLVSGGGKLSNYYRPILFTGFAVEYRVFGDSGFIYHLNSILIHFLGGLLLYLIIKKIFKNNLLALLTSMLFTIHPIQTEAVSYASGRGDPLSFALVMLVIFLSLSNHKKYLVISLISMIFAFLSKELAIITPGFIFLAHLFQEQSFSKSTIKKCVILTAPFLIISIFYFLLRISILNFSNTLNFYNGTNIYTDSLFVRINTFFDLIPTYIQLLIFPKDLFMERDSGITIQTFITFQSAASLFLLVGAGTFAYIKRKTSPTLLFSIIWIIVAFIPTSGIIPINGIFYEHFLYYPSVGFFLLGSTGILFFYNKSRGWMREAIIIFVFLFLIMLSFRTISRNSEWHDPITFYNQTLSYVKSARAYNNLAMAYAEKGSQSQSIDAYKKAIYLSDTYPETHFNLANVYLATGATQSAEKEYRKALIIDPGFYLAYGSLFRLYQASGNQTGKDWVATQLKEIGSKNPVFLQYLHQLQAQ